MTATTVYKVIQCDLDKLLDIEIPLSRLEGVPTIAFPITCQWLEIENAKTFNQIFLLSNFCINKQSKIKLFCLCNQQSLIDRDTFVDRFQFVKNQ